MCGHSQCDQSTVLVHLILFSVWGRLLSIELQLAFLFVAFSVSLWEYLDVSALFFVMVVSKLSLGSVGMHHFHPPHSCLLIPSLVTWTPHMHIPSRTIFILSFISPSISLICWTNQCGDSQGDLCEQDCLKEDNSCFSLYSITEASVISPLLFQCTKVEPNDCNETEWVWKIFPNFWDGLRHDVLYWCHFILQYLCSGLLKT